jgi:hypothetical protein
MPKSLKGARKEKCKKERQARGQQNTSSRPPKKGKQATSKSYEVDKQNSQESNQQNRIK